MTRPLSPHLKIYAPQWTSILSILHRLTGIGLGLFWIFCTFLFWQTKTYPEKDFSVLFQWIVDGGIFCFFYHLLNGIRHLFWDLGWGFGLERAEKNGRVILIFSILLTIFFEVWIAS